MDRIHGGSSSSSTLATINAAASAIAAGGAAGPRALTPRRRWLSCLSPYWCFGSNKHRKRIGNAVFLSESETTGNSSSMADNSHSTSSMAHIYAAPPSSPASFLQSGNSSATQSPLVFQSLSSSSPRLFSPGERPSMFRIGPYAHETQLVSPPVFSAFTTEPSTAPFTPPPESVHMTTPSSPEVPFAKLLDPVSPLSHCKVLPYPLYPSEMNFSPKKQSSQEAYAMEGGDSGPFLATLDESNRTSADYEFHNYDLSGQDLGERISFALTLEEAAMARTHGGIMEGEEEERGWKECRHSATLGSVKEFKFECEGSHCYGGREEEEKAGGGEGSLENSNWCFFPLLQAEVV